MWRASLAAAFTLPADAPDFACPHGVEWGAAEAVRAAGGGVASVVRPVPRDEWPVWARGMAWRRRREDIGVGDTVARLIGPTASAAFKRWYSRLFGGTCGCDRRRAEWNAMYRYGDA